MMNNVKVLLTSTLETLWGVGVSVAAGTLLERLYNLVSYRASHPRWGLALPAQSAIPAQW